MASPAQRKRDKRKRRIKEAQKRARQVYRDPALGRLRQFKDDGKCRIVILCRASTRKMEWDGRLKAQIEDALRRAHKLGITRLNGRLVAIYFGVESGKPDAKRPVTEAATRHALLHDAVLVVIERSRLLRPSNFNGRWEYEPPTEDDWELLCDRFPCQMSSFEPPDLTPAEARKIQIRRGQRKGRGGRPYNNPEAIRQARLLRRTGASISEISVIIHQPKSSVGRWLLSFPA